MNTPTVNAAPPAAPQGRKLELAGGVFADMLNRVALLGACSKLGLPADEDSTNDQLAIALYTWFSQHKASGAEDFTCTDCKGMSTSAVDTCPYCGSGSEGGAGLGEPAPSPVPASASTIDIPPPAPVTTVVAAAPVEDPGAIDASKMPESVIAEPSNGKPRKRGRAAVPPAPPVPTPSTALATTAPAVNAEIVTVTELDKAIEELRAAQGEAMLAWWREGKALDKIFSGDLWKLRTDGGKQRYTSFEQFTTAELGMSSTYAYDHLDAARCYTEQQARLLGKTNSFLALQKSPEVRAKLLQAAEARVGTSGPRKRGGQVAPALTTKEAKEILASDPVEKKPDDVIVERGGKKRKRGKGNAKPKAKPGAATLSMAKYLGKDQLPLTVKGKPVKLPASLEGATAMLTSVNGIVEKFTLKSDKKGFAILVSDRKREE